ncbi:MAG: hypothetical protein ACRD0K_04630 [Egibacteraceae bacterium]
MLECGGFDVSDRPGPQRRYDPVIGYRVDSTTGAAVCVHPFRVGLPPGRYASRGDPLPPTPDAPLQPSAAQLELPEDVTDLEAWFIATLRVADQERMAPALQSAEAIALKRFPSKDVVAALRRVLASELCGR